MGQSDAWRHARAHKSDLEAPSRVLDPNSSTVPVADTAALHAAVEPSVPPSSSMDADGFYELPQAFVTTADRNELVSVIIVGWGDHAFMEVLLSELDHGDQSLPVGSTVVFVNTETRASTVGRASARVGVSCLKLHHVRVCNPPCFIAFRCFCQLSMLQKLGDLCSE